jgi:hypothetical protein
MIEDAAAVGVGSLPELVALDDELAPSTGVGTEEDPGTAEALDEKAAVGLEAIGVEVAAGSGTALEEDTVTPSR